MEASLEIWVSESRRRLGLKLNKWCSIEGRFLERPRILQKEKRKEEDLPSRYPVGVELIFPPGASTLEPGGVDRVPRLFKLILTIFKEKKMKKKKRNPPKKREKRKYFFSLFFW
ncbi:MAG: hypothetical protein AAFP00_09555, partial [Bacteroidota bacterium]